jgi:hypothetical protein
LDFTSDAFKALLSWLDADPVIAGRKYETIRAGLVRIFVSKGFSDAEDLADLTIDRVATLLPEKSKDYVGEPAKLFYAVARYICYEAWRRPEIATEELPERADTAVNTSAEFECLLECLKCMTPEEREFILDYHVYDGEGRVKIEHHKMMKEEQGVEESTLRVHARRIRVRLEKCILKRMEALRAKQNTSPPALSKKGDAARELKGER